MTRRRKKTGSLLGSIAGAIMNLFARNEKTTRDHLKKIDFPASTQKTGIRFNKKIRDKFRSKWIKRR
jgi:hypothetical protein